MRDLAWACFSPSMLEIAQIADPTTGITECGIELTHARQQWLARLDRDPAALLQHLSSHPTHRLGVYFEQLWHFFLMQDPQIELVAHNLAVHHEGRTLGEFDCLYYSAERARHVHLELAVKFFLGVPRSGDATTAANAYEWLGPDQRDRLQTKQEQLLQRQILLGEAPAAKRVLADIGIHDVAREIALKGYLFQPTSDAPPPPPGFNPSCTLDYWVTYQQLERHCNTLDAAAFTILPKMHWLSLVQCSIPETLLSVPALLARLPIPWENDHYPQLIAAVDKNGMESSRFFVTPGSWPDVQGP